MGQIAAVCLVLLTGSPVAGHNPSPGEGETWDPGSAIGDKRPGGLALETSTGSSLSFDPLVDAERWSLTVVGRGVVLQASAEGRPPVLLLEDRDGRQLPDGQYQFELRAHSASETKVESEHGGPEGNRVGHRQTGTFVVQDGQRLDTFSGELTETGGRQTENAAVDRAGTADGLQTKSSPAVLKLGDACIGANCGTGDGSPYPSSVDFGYLKLRAIRTGIVFADQSSANGLCATEGCRDWQISANSGPLKADYFAVFDLGTNGGILGGAAFEDSPTVSSVPFRLDAGAPTDALRVATSGNVGMGTATPVEELEISSGDPTIRLSDTAGFEWSLNNAPSGGQFDIVSTEGGANPVRHFFVERGAPDDQLMLTSSGIGIGTATPSATLEIEGASGTSQLLIDERGADANVEVMFNLVCNCAPGFRMNNSTNGQVWFFRHTSAGDFSFDDPNSAGLEARLDSSGNMFLKGSLSQGSSRALKENLEAVNGEKVLDVLTKLDLYEWSYIDEGARHFGPMAEEFSAAYGLGESKARIAPSDMAGLALAASKTLAERLEAENGQLKTQLSNLKTQFSEQKSQFSAMLDRLEALEKQQ